MLYELWLNYVDTINGATKMTKRKATQMAKALLQQSGLEPAAEKVTKLAEDIMAASKAQRDNLEAAVNAEVDRAVKRVGFVRKEEFDKVKSELAQLKKTMVKEQTAARQSSAKKAPVASGVNKTPTATKSAAKVAESETSDKPAKKTATRKRATKAPGTKAPVKKSTPRATRKSTTRKQATSKSSEPTKAAEAKPSEAKQDTGDQS